MIYTLQKAGFSLIQPSVLLTIASLTMVAVLPYVQHPCPPR